MSLEAAAGRLCVVTHHGRRYIVRAPTLATVMLASGLFPKEIAAFAKMAVDNPALLERDDEMRRGILGQLTADVDGGRVGEVLETCCGRIGGNKGEVMLDASDDPSLAVALAVAVLSLCDAKRCFVSAGWEELGKKTVDELEHADSAGDWFDPSDYATEVGIDTMAREFHCSTQDVMRWPFEVVIMANEVRSIRNDPKRLEAMAAASRDFPIEDPMWAALGIGYEKVN